MNLLTSARGRRAATGAAALALVAAACTACVGGSTPSSGSTAGQGGAATTATPDAPAVTTTPTAATTAAAATKTTSTTSTDGSGSGSGSGGGNGGGPSTCQTRQLAGSIGSTQGAAGSEIVSLVFRNTGSTPCTLTGYPGVSFGAGKPVAQLGQPAARDPQTAAKIVTLIPGAHAFALLQVGDAGNWPASTCDPAPTTYLRVYPPNDSTLLYIPYTSAGCLGDVVTLHVQAVQPGAGPTA